MIFFGKWESMLIFALMKKKVLIVNKFYYRRGGDCVYTLNLERLLRDHGHDVAVYSMQYPDNLETSWNGYFASEVNFQKNKLKGFLRIFGYAGVEKSFSRLLRDFKPDVVHFNNIHSYLSPAIVKLAFQSGAFVVWTMHDYKLVCPAYSCLKNGKICEDCFYDPAAVLKSRCMKGSLSASILAYAEARMWSMEKILQWTDIILCPSRFMAKKLEQGGISPTKLYQIYNFIDSEALEKYSERNDVTSRQDYYCYIGRLSSEKGIKTLLKVASRLPYELRVAGSGPLEEQLRLEYGSCKNIKLLGHCNFNELQLLLSKARFSVVPSEWYENNPFSVIESLCCGTPFVGADIGGIPELADMANGIKYSLGNPNNLRLAIEEAWTREWDYNTIRTDAMKKFSPEQHYCILNKIYNR